jgi:cell division protein FtsB
MKILAAIKREERKLEKQVAKLQRELDGVRAAARSLGHSVAGVKKRVLSEAGRAKIAKAAKKRWAKVRAEAKKALK